MIVPPGQNIGGRVPPLGGPVPLSHSDRRPCSMPINAVTSVQRCISIEQKLPTRNFRNSTVLFLSVSVLLIPVYQ